MKPSFFFREHGLSGSSDSLSETTHYHILSPPHMEGIRLSTYDFRSCFFPKFKVMHFQHGDIKLHTVVLLFLCFFKILTQCRCRWSWSRRSTVNNCRVREFQIPDRRAQ